MIASRNRHLRIDLLGENHGRLEKNQSPTLHQHRACIRARNIQGTGAPTPKLKPMLLFTLSLYSDPITFNIDIETCDKCGGDVRIIASIEDPAVIRTLLA